MKTDFSEKDKYKLNDDIKGFRQNEENLFNSIFSCESVGMFRITPSGVVEYFNAAFAEILGFVTPEEKSSIIELTSKPDSIFENVHAYYKILQKTVNNPGTFQIFEERFRRKDGRIINGLLTLWYRNDSENGVNHIYGFLEDLSEGKSAIQELYLNEKKYRAFFDHTPHGIVIIDPETAKVIDFNDQVCQQLGYTREEFSKLSLMNIEIIESSDEILTHIKKVQNEGFDNFETLQRTKQGELRNVQVVAQIIKIGNQQIYHCIWNDITERKQANKNLELTQSRLLEAQSVSHTGSWELDLKTQEVWGSAEAQKLYGLESVVGSKVPWSLAADLVEEQFREMRDQALSDFIAYGDEKPYDIEFFIRRRNDGERRAIHSRAKLIRDTQGNPLRVVGTVQDITELKQAEEDIRQLNCKLEQRVIERTSQLEAANRELKTFSYSVSHDLRAPLRAIRGYSEILLSDFAEQLDEQTKSYLKKIMDSSQWMDQIITELINLSEIGHQKFTQKITEISSIAHEIMNTLQSREPQRKVALSITEGMIAYCDSNLMKMVYQNLLENAWKFTSKNKDYTEIQIGMLEKDLVNIFFVKDNGVGFDMVHAGKIFQPFERIHNKQDFPGTGIGLSIVHRIIQRHGGRIWAESQPGVGTTIYFTLEPGIN